MRRSFYKTVKRIEILTQDRPFKSNDLLIIAEEIDEGEASGVVTTESTEEVTPEQMKKLLIAQGSDPSFLNLDGKTVSVFSGPRQDTDDEFPWHYPEDGFITWVCEVFQEADEDEEDLNLEQSIELTESFGYTVEVSEEQYLE